MTKHNCHECIHRATLPGNCHIRCRHVSAKVGMNPHGVQNGWGFWPLEFDPIWVESCNGYSQDPADRFQGGEDDPLMGLLAMLEKSIQP